MSDSSSLFADASQRLEKALQHVKISEDAVERLRHPKASLTVSVPVRMMVHFRFLRAIESAMTIPEALVKEEFVITPMFL